MGSSSHGTVAADAALHRERFENLARGLRRRLESHRTMPRAAAESFRWPRRVAGAVRTGRSAEGTRLDRRRHHAGDLDRVAYAESDAADPPWAKQPAGRHPTGRGTLRRRSPARLGAMGLAKNRHARHDRLPPRSGVMEFDNSFDVPLSPPQAWAVLLDIRRIAPCLPGAELTEVVDAQNYRGKIAVRLGPVALSFAGRVQLEDIDEANYSARVKAQGSDDKGRGAANAAATFRVEPTERGSRVLIHTDLMLSGAVAQYGRGVGMIQATAAQIIGQFADNLRAQLAETPKI